MANIGVNYDSLSNVQAGLKGINEQLDDTWDALDKGNTAISDISNKHNGVFGDSLKNINKALEAIELGAMADIDELIKQTKNVQETFYDAEGQIISNLDQLPDDLANYFFDENEPDPNGYTISENTGAETTKDAETTGPASSGGGSTGATGGTGASSALVGSTATQEEMDEELPEKKETEEKDDNKQNSSNENKDNNTTNDDKNTSDDKKDSSSTNDNKDNSDTFKEARDNANKATSKETSKSVLAGVTGGSAIGAATKAAETAGNTTSSKKDDSNDEKDENGVKAEALGDTTSEDGTQILGQLEAESGTHQTSPIDVTIKNKSGTTLVPTLAGIAAAGFAGVGTKAFLDKKEKEEDEEEEKESYSGDYEEVGEENNLLDNSDNIGFNPDEIIEEGESNSVTDSANNNSVIEDIKKSAEENDGGGFNAMPALAGAAAAGLAGGGIIGLLKKEDDEDDEEEDPKDFE